MSNKQLSLIDSGSESIVQLATAFDGTKTIIKTVRPGGKVDYLFEAFAYSHLLELGARVPKVVSVSAKELEMTAFAGETIDDQIDLYNKATIFHEAARDLALARQVTFPGYGKALAQEEGYVGSLKTWREFLDQAFVQLEASTKIPSDIKSAFIDYWRTVVSDIEINTGMLVHGDFSLSAIYVQNGEYEGIIDFGDAFIGDPLMDLAYFRFKELTKDCGQLVYDHLVAGYLKHVKIERTYLEKAVRLYMIYWAVQRIEAENLEDEIIAKFIDKARLLASLISSSFGDQ